MREAQNESGSQWGNGIADHIFVELHDASNYWAPVIFSSEVALSTDGLATVIVPCDYSDSYYITIKHRNSIETTTATAISFAGTTITQSFGNPANVFGNNLGGPLGGKYFIYGGDDNHDGLVDIGDYTSIENGANDYLTGYLDADINGDGLIDIGDYTIVENNSNNYIGAFLP